MADEQPEFVDQKSFHVDEHAKGSIYRGTNLFFNFLGAF